MRPYVHHRYQTETYLPCSIEPVKVIYPDGKVVISPDLSSRQTEAYASYVNSCTGLNLSAPEVKDLLERMSLKAELSPDDTDKVLVSVPPTRPDILHQCDIMEDAAIAYGFNNLPHTFPATSTVAQPLAVSKISDIIRHEWAYAGWVEVLPLILVASFRSVCQPPAHKTRVMLTSVPMKKTSPGLIRLTITRPQSRSRIPKRSSFR